MLKHFLQAFSQLDDRQFRSVLIKGLLSALVALVCVALLARYGFGHTDVPLWDAPDWVLDVGAGAVFLGASWFLFPAIATAVMSLFLDDIIDAVEAKHYPNQLATRRLGVSQALWMSVKLLGLVLLVNILAIPFYIALLFTAIGPFALFAALNGYLLGREYFEMVAIRHISAREAKPMRRAYRGRVFLLGLGITGLFAIPIVNLIAPLVGAGAAVHSFHKINREEASWSGSAPRSQLRG